MMNKVIFKGVDLRQAVLPESILLQSKFEAMGIAGADSTNALLDGE